MKHSFCSRVLALVFSGFCASCSSPGQSVQKTIDVEEMSKAALSIGIESGDTQLVVFYVVNNSASDINMLTWNTPFEQVLSADIFLATQGDREMPYLGRKVKRSDPTSDNYLLIPAGQKLKSDMDIAKYYGLTEPGEYTLTINLPQLDGLTQLNQETEVSVETDTLQVVVSN